MYVVVHVHIRNNHVRKCILLEIWNSLNPIHAYMCTVKPPNNGHIGTTNFVRYMEMSVARRVQRSRAYLMS